MATTTVPLQLGAGGAHLPPSGSGKPSLRDCLDAAARDLAAAKGTPAWLTAQAVTTHVLVMGSAGWVLAVEGTTGSGTGPKQMQVSGSPAAGAVQVEYDGDGIATLTFNATDAITVAAVMLQPFTAVELLPSS